MRSINNNNDNIVPLPEAARLLGINPQGLREHMKRGHLDVGLVLPGLKGKHKQYIVYKSKLEKVIGREIESEDKQNE